MKKEKIVLVGAGLVGSLFAIYLAKKGYKVAVYERRPDYRKTGIAGGRSINLALSDRGWKALRSVGIDKDIEKIAIPMTGRMMHAVDGTLTYQPYGKDDQAIYSVSRSELNFKLLDLADENENVEIHYSMKCLDVDLKSKTVKFENTDTNEVVTASGDYILGSDGAFSAIRSRMQRTNRFSYSQEYIPHGYKELCIPANEDGSFKLKDVNCLHIWARGNYMMIALPNLDGSFTCTLFFPFEGEYSFESLKTDEDILAFFKEKFPDAVPMMPTLLEDYKANPTSSLLIIRCNPWNFGENTLLVGDASHAIVPFYGQGMNSGFEDCTVFDELMKKNNDDLSKTFSEYTAARVDDANAIADLAMYNFVEMRDRVADNRFLLQKKIEKKLNADYPDKWLPLYSMVTFSHIPYAEALRIGRIQEEIMQEVLDMEGVHENWENMDFSSIIDFDRLKSV